MQGGEATSMGVNKGWRHMVAVVADTGAVVIFMAFGVRMSKSHLGFMV